MPCDEIGEPNRHELLLDSQPVDKKLRLTLMSERGKNALNPCDTYITSGLGCFSHKGRTSVARGSFHDKSKPATSENREFPKKQAFRRRQNVPHQARAPLDCSRVQRVLVAPKAGVSQRTETNKRFWVKQGGFLMWRVLKSGNTQEEWEGSVGNGVTLEHRRPGFAW